MTTYLDADHGLLLKCDNETILCNTEEWLVDGSVNMRQPEQQRGTGYSVIFQENEGWLLQENDHNILLEDGSYLLWKRAAALSATTYTDIVYI